MAVKNFRAGEILFRSGDISNCAYLVESGQVEILSGDEGLALRVGQVGPGEILGEMSLIEERPHSLVARAVTDVSVTIMTRTEFERNLLHDPQGSRRYLRSLFERLREMTARAVTKSLPAIDGNPAPSTARIVVFPITRKAAECLPDDGLTVTTFPFRIGRASEAKEEQPLDLNDLWLLDVAPFQVSRNHLSIDIWDGQQFIVRDRGSHLGTIVNEQLIGGKARATVAALTVGDNVIVAGSAQSPYQFRINIQE